MFRRIASFAYEHIVGILMILGIAIAWWGMTHPNGLKIALGGVIIFSLGLMIQDRKEDSSGSSDSSSSEDSVDEGWFELFGKIFKKLTG